MNKFLVSVAALYAVFLVAPTQADIAVEFGDGATPLDKIDFSKPSLSRKEQVVVDWFADNATNNLDQFACYEADLKRLKNGKKRGTGIDCLGLNPIFTAIPRVGTFGSEHVTPDTPPGGSQVLDLQIEAATFFFFPGGHFVSKGRTTVRPIFDGVGDGLDGGPGPFGAITHLTASIPGSNPTIVDATRRFRKLKDKGQVRLSGAVNTETFFVDQKMAFSCIFVMLNDGRGAAGNNPKPKPKPKPKP